MGATSSRAQSRPLTHGNRLNAPPLCCREVYLTIAGAFGVSAAIENTGVAAKAANGIISIGKSIGGTGPALIGKATPLLLLGLGVWPMVALHNPQQCVFALRSDLHCNSDHE